MSIPPPDTLTRQVNIPAGTVDNNTGHVGILPLDYDWGPDGPPPEEPPQLVRRNADHFGYPDEMIHDRPFFCSPRPSKKARH